MHNSSNMPKVFPLNAKPKTFNSDNFMVSVETSFLSRPLWDVLDDIAFWVKDAQSRFVWVNKTFARQAGANREEIIGTKDSDWFYNELASVYVQDDQGILSTAKPIINKPELVMNIDGYVSWHLTTKYPCIDKTKTIVGTCGMCRIMEGNDALPAEYIGLEQIINYARKHIAEAVQVRDLASYARMSVSTLERHVFTHLRMTPQQLLYRLRMSRARYLLVKGRFSIAEISVEAGYESVSSFTRAFKKYYNTSPKRFRETQQYLTASPN